MQAIQLHEDKFLKISWEEEARVIGIDWKEATSSLCSTSSRNARRVVQSGMRYLV